MEGIPGISDQGSGGQSMTVNTGSSIVDQLISMLNTYGGIYDTQRGQDLTSQANAANNATTQRGQDLSASTAAAQLQADYQKAQLQYDSDMKTYGLAVAQFNWTQNVQKIQSQVSALQAQTQASQSNYTQRQGQADTKLAVMKALADRSGPQNWVAYNSFANMLDGPTPSSSATFDPMKIAENLYQPGPTTLPDVGLNPSQFSAAPPMSSTPPPAAVAPPRAPTAPPPAGGPAPAAPPSTAPPPSPGANGAAWSNINSTPKDPVYFSGGGSQIWDSATQGWKDRVTGQPIPMAAGGMLRPHPNLQAGPQRPQMQQPGGEPAGQAGPAMQALRLRDNPDYQPGGMIHPGVMRHPKTGRMVSLAKGGTVDASGKEIGPVQVGDSPSGTPTGNEELAMVHNPGPDTQLEVQPANPSGMAAQDAQGGSPTPDMASSLDQMLGQPGAGSQGAQQDPKQAMGMAEQAIQMMTQALQALQGAMGLGGDQEGPGEDQGEGAEPGAAGGGMFKRPGMKNWRTQGAGLRARQPNTASARQQGPGMRTRPGGQPLTAKDMAIPTQAAPAGPLPRIGTPGPQGSPLSQIFQSSPLMALGQPPIPHAAGGGQWGWNEAGSRYGASDGSMPMPSATGIQEKPQQWGESGQAQQFQAPPAQQWGQKPHWSGGGGWGGQQRAMPIQAQPAGGMGTMPIQAQPVGGGGMGMMPLPAQQIHPDHYGLAAMVQQPAHPEMGGGMPPQQQWQPDYQGQGYGAMGGMWRAAGGGVYDTGANTSPNMTIDRYSPQALGSQPFIQKLQGRLPAPSFQGVGNGGLLSNPDIGASGISPYVNLQTYRDMLPSEQLQTQDLYSQGLAQYWPDVLGRSQSAAPTGMPYYYQGAGGWG